MLSISTLLHFLSQLGIKSQPLKGQHPPLTTSIQAHHNCYLLSIGHGRYDQQQDIPVVTPYTWNLQIDLNISQVWDGGSTSTL